MLEKVEDLKIQVDNLCQVRHMQYWRGVQPEAMRTTDHQLELPLNSCSVKRLGRHACMLVPTCTR